MTASRTCEVAIVGGGPVGAALALALHASGIQALLLEAREASSNVTTRRPLALSHGSRLILERLGVWESLADATPIRRIHISQRGRFGRTVLDADQASLPALGYVTDYAGVVGAFDAALKRAGIEVIRGARVASIAHDPRSARVVYDDGAGSADCIAALVAVADGSAAAAEVEVRTTDYGQAAVTAVVTIDGPHRNIAYERFTPEGPLALLPSGDAYAVVWTVAHATAADLVSATQAEFIARLQERFGERAGRFLTASARAAQHLVLRVAERVACGRAVLIGNAAQALHPVAGQGFNLGLRDAWELASETARRGASSPDLPQAYAARRRLDRTGGIAFTDALVRIFSNDFAPLAHARGAGLALLDNLPPLKDFVARRMIFGSRG
ncbi:MAG TPA: FAD-dependent monooxygenase [Burkholderiales bacterium]|nr:FAD-dependent monooxygenase [Burkholderiales bacterium]